MRKNQDFWRRIWTIEKEIVSLHTFRVYSHAKAVKQ